MYLHIYSLQRPKFYREVQAVTVKTPLGEITVLDNHRPLVTPLVKGPIVVRDAKGETVTIDAEGGVLEVRPGPPVGGEVNILAD